MISPPVTTERETALKYRVKNKKSHCSKKHVTIEYRLEIVHFKIKRNSLVLSTEKTVF